ncbi:Gp49 family protein [Burkholderia gladioli]|uniref:Gp49 family protein n=1 Tax=Burkholderia gladioli TaxID=28095 RepID=UPI000CDB1C0E|nr:Gp49 family protein [Burkholderia gladioli]POS08060.1 hypothetical protein C3Y08_11240 [Burkholderia gladioli]
MIATFAIENGAPALDPIDIEWAIADELYHVFPGTTMTVCCLVFHNGFKVLGHYTSITPTTYNEQFGRENARRAALQSALPYFSFLLMQELYEAVSPDAVSQQG